MGDGALGSDHVNYLVLRYLQESGFETAAKSLYREWYRNDEFRDPEDFPFAPAVKQHELVHIIQDGLFHDQLQATVANGTRRFNLTSTDVDFQAQRTKSISRRQSVYTSNDRDEFAIPPAKRIRQSNASDIITNGDAMDVDDRGDDDDRTSNPSEQDRALSESEPLEQVMIETKAMGTQTEEKKKAKTKTMYWSIDKSLPVSILYTAWSSSQALSSFLLAAGESLCRVYEVSSGDAHLQGIENLDPVPMTSEHTVTAIAWHPSGQFFTCALQGPPRVDGVHEYKAQLLDVSPTGEKRPYDDIFNMVTIVLRYTRSGNTLFAASSDGQRSVLEARDVTSPDHHGWPTAFEHVEDNVVMDIAPISETSFAVCGKGLVSVWSIGDAEPSDESAELRLIQDYVHTVPVDISFDKIRYDWRHELLIAIATSSGHTCTLRKDGGAWSHGPSLPIPADAGTRITAICFEPSMPSLPTPSEHPQIDDGMQPPSRLAIGMANDQSGKVCLFNATSDSIEQSASLELEQQEPPLALSWTASSNGSGVAPARLAAASDEAIRVWDISAGSTKELLSWKAAPANWYQGDDNHLPDDEDATEPSLSWDVKGERLAFAVGRKMAIVSMVPESQMNGVNGTLVE
ncbi:Hypothetical protein D9617_11g009500 [Elsinoe fawcettii]|nr:Hypothetical protein D9617_11g009500 [Elsinoe fawcettii]